MSVIKRAFLNLRHSFKFRLAVVTAIIVANIVAGFLPGLPILSQVSGMLYLLSAVALLALTIAQACNVLSKDGRGQSSPKKFALLNLILAAQFLSATLLVGEFLTSFYIISSPAALIPMPTIFVSIIGGLTTVMMIGLLWQTRKYGSDSFSVAMPMQTNFCNESDTAASTPAARLVTMDNGDAVPAAGQENPPSNPFST